MRDSDIDLDLPMASLAEPRDTNAEPDNGDAISSGPVRSLAKGLAALDLLRSGKDVRTTDLAQHLGIDKGAATRILQTLLQAGYAERTSGRRYRSGLRLREAIPGPDPLVSIRPNAQPLLARLSSELGEAVYLGIMVDGQVLYIDKLVPPDESLRVERSIPTLAPLFNTAIGKVYVAALNIPIPASLPASTPKTITNPQIYAEEIEVVRRNGYSRDDEELNLGIRCVAAPLFGRQGQVSGVLCATVPSVRLPADQLDKYGIITKRIADSFVAP